MTCIVLNQKSTESINAGVAFRFAYSQAKRWKFWIWMITFFLAVLQTGVSIFLLKNKAPSFDFTPYVVFVLILTVIISSFGKRKVSEWQSLACTIQRLHDYLVLNIGVKPTQIEIPKGKIIDFSKKWLTKKPEDIKDFEEWWSVKLNRVPFPVAKVIATYSTISWENELRKKYQTLLTTLIIIIFLGLLSLAIFLNYTVAQAIIFIIAPFTPFISVILDELIANKQSLMVADKLNTACYSTWESIIMGKLAHVEIEQATEQHMNFWQTHRQLATPIFDWFYRRAKAKMEQEMIINTDELIETYLKSLSK
ncbi:S-4TM family putative pore-forming effector [Aeromonas dhakensis]|uniref:S-4TM family putative pore-forming effector n=1 Tax=Aeromonas dhakensis TaxID=196024 RepID=UPI0020B2E9FD|nr:S-4TM family putative pore-forming effector [Aeromonas dhakensis]CAD7490129.1 hypothetical protein KBAD45_08920 [Aeromonas dhakensis]CAD7495271.1 hypothetical protein KBAD59_08940 [Aeromonas dhakensis]CAD7495372.1 hypothetical protein KBAD11_08920 [Aeromonas dhakensis]CAD7503279.1 hypothetical protein KBAD14_KBAD14_08930 [Aeromonas dhakensis]CAD7503444.1 hypothetical protein KBAD10_08940 [Aeromonas dhakensis]